jgi:hypothetical protein
MHAHQFGCRQGHPIIERHIKKYGLRSISRTVRKGRMVYSKWESPSCHLRRVFVSRFFVPKGDACYRLQVIKEGALVLLFSAHGNEWTERRSWSQGTRTRVTRSKNRVSQTRLVLQRRCYQ